MKPYNSQVTKDKIYPIINAVAYKFLSGIENLGLGIFPQEANVLNEQILITMNAKIRRIRKRSSKCSIFRIKNIHSCGVHECIGFYK